MVYSPAFISLVAVVWKLKFQVDLTGFVFDVIGFKIDAYRAGQGPDYNGQDH